MSVKITLVGWPVGVRKDAVAEPIRFTLEGPGSMFPSPDDPEMSGVLRSIMAEVNLLVKIRTGVGLQWEMEKASA